MEDERWTVLEMVPVPPADEKLVLIFFRAFSRFEYAMKQAKYRRTKISGQLARVEPDWEQLKKKLERGLNEKFADPSAYEDVSYLREFPPEVQVVDDAGALGFQPCRGGSLLDYVKRVRNNLFHGAKQPWDSYRDSRLVGASLDVLAASLELDRTLREAYRR